MSQPLEPRREPGTRNWWRILAWTAAVVLAVGGLAVLALVVTLVSAANSYGSNK
jgi:hypothetical protein